MMLKWLQKIEKTTTLLPLVSIVWKQFVLHVVLWLLGLYLTSLNFPQRFLTGWKMCIQQSICDPTISALIKHAWSFELLSALALEDIWKETSCFIVDSYHYINHQTSDYLCRKWCNPAPLNGSAPNLVIVTDDANGNSHYKCAFNTQVCSLLKFTNANIHLLFFQAREQLNSWIGGFQSILN
jgi:hypothetical protein